MNISLFLRDLTGSVRDIFKSNRSKLLVVGAVFLAGMILGFIFYRRIEATEWLYIRSTNLVLIIVQSRNFFAVWFQNFWQCAKIVIILFCLNLFSFGKYLHYILIAVRGLVMAVGSVVLIVEFGFMGGVYLIVIFLVRTVFLLGCIFIGKFICVSDGSCCNRYCWQTAKKYLFMLAVCFVYCLLNTLVVFFLLRPLFAVG